MDTVQVLSDLCNSSPHRLHSSFISLRNSFGLICCFVSWFIPQIWMFLGLCLGTPSLPALSKPAHLPPWLQPLSSLGQCLPHLLFSASLLSFSLSSNSYMQPLPEIYPEVPQMLQTQRVENWSLEKEMATYSSILAWEISWTEEPGGLCSPWHRRVGHNLATEQYHTSRHIVI